MKTEKKKMEFRRTRSELASLSSPQRATGMRTRPPSFKDMVMQALGIKYVGLVMNPLVRNLLRDELKRSIVPQIEFAVRQQVHGELQNIIPLLVNQIAFVMRQQMREELMNAITQINTQTNDIVVQQVEPRIARADHLLRPPRLHIREVGPAAPNLQLSFRKKLLQPTFFAEDLIKDEDNNNLQVALRLIESGQIYSLPLEFPVEVEIVVIDGELPGDSSGEWSTEEFNSKILKGREGKKPLLLGACKARLHEGIASFGDIKLTDSSSILAKSGKFKLVAKVSPTSHIGWVIKPAVTECFAVLVERSKQHQKNYPPSLDDEIFRLVNIRLNGPYMNRLAAHNITTVKDFLKLSVVDQERLQKITDMSKKMLNETVRHANTCDKGEVLYMYSRESFHLILNSICQVQSVTINGVPCQLEHLTQRQTEYVKKLVSEAYDKGDNLERFYGNSPSRGELGPSSPVSQNTIWTGTGAHTNGLEQLPPSHINNAQENWNHFHGSSGASSSGIIETQQNGSLLDFRRLDSFTGIHYGFDSNETSQSHLFSMGELWQP